MILLEHGKMNLLFFIPDFKVKYFKYRTSIVLKWVNMKRKYEGYWAYFSTLGGAYSSLGEDSYEMVI